MSHKKRIAIFFILYLSYTFIYLARINFSMASPELIENGALNAVQVGILGSLFSNVYAIGRLLNGSKSDTVSPWKMLTIGLGAVGLSNICVGFFPPFLGFALFWTINAFAQSMLWSSVLCVLSNIYDKNIAKKKTSAMVTSVAMGNILGIIVNTRLITDFGLKYAFFVPGILSIVCAVAVLLSIKKIKAPAEGEKRHLSIIKLLRQKELLIMSIPAALHGVMKENISLWMAVYIIDTYMVDLRTSSYYILLIPLIGFIGRTLYPVLFKLFGERENRVSQIGFLICILSAFVLCLGKTSISLSVASLGIIYAAVSVINTSMVSIYPLKYTSTGNQASVSGLMDFSTYLGAGISSAVYGVIIKHFGYLPMFASWLVIALLSMIILSKINKN